MSLRALGGYLGGLSDVADLYDDVSTQLVDRWSQTETFPAPVAELKQGRVWDVREIEGWIVTHRPDYAAKRRK